MCPYAKEILINAYKDQEAAPMPSKSFFSSLTSPVLYSDSTISGISVSSRMTEQEADASLALLTDHLNSNFETLCVSLSSQLAQEAIKCIWQELLSILDLILLPHLTDPIEKDRKMPNARQISFMDLTLKSLKAFFHADGEGIGIPLFALETAKYLDIMTALSRYGTDLPRLKRECELGVESGRNKEAVLRLVRLVFEKDDCIEDKEQHRDWMNQILQKRKV